QIAVFSGESDWDFSLEPELEPPEAPEEWATPLEPPPPPESASGGSGLLVTIAILVAVAIAVAIWVLLRMRVLTRPERVSAGDTEDEEELTPEQARTALDHARERLSTVVDAHDAVIAAWLSLETAIAAAGVQRRPSQTTLEFVVDVLAPSNWKPRRSTAWPTCTGGPCSTTSRWSRATATRRWPVWTPSPTVSMPARPGRRDDRHPAAAADADGGLRRCRPGGRRRLRPVRAALLAASPDRPGRGGRGPAVDLPRRPPPGRPSPRPRARPGCRLRPPPCAGPAGAPAGGYDLRCPAQAPHDGTQPLPGPGRDRRRARTRPRSPAAERGSRLPDRQGPPSRCR